MTEATKPDLAWITCPKCKMDSYNPVDIVERYCGHCHEFLADMVPARGWWNLTCFNALSPAQQERLISHGNLPLGYRAEGDICLNGAEVAIETQDDRAPGPRFYCRACAIAYLSRPEPATMSAPVTK